MYSIEYGELFSALMQAWQHAQDKKSAPGLDGIDIADFRQDSDYQLRKLAEGIIDETYCPRPVRVFEFIKGKKSRKIGILCLQDRIVQHALARLLGTIFESRFLDCSYAFRPGRSAKSAIQQVCSFIQNGANLFFRSDIDSFFDTINHDILLKKIEPDVNSHLLRTIEKCIKLTEIEQGMPKKRNFGLCQGGPLSPILANVYLMDFDAAMVGNDYSFIRYCDDFVCLFKTSNAKIIDDIESHAKNVLLPLDLTLKQKKTSKGDVAQGFNFLGYRFSDSGTIVQIQAIEALIEKLQPKIEKLFEQLNQKYRQTNIMQTYKLDWSSVADIFRGWLQFYEINDAIFTHINIWIAGVALAAIEKDNEKIACLMQLYETWNENDELQYGWEIIAEVCASFGDFKQAIDVYEKWFGKMQNPAVQDISECGLYEAWARYRFADCSSSLEILVQAYIDAGDYSFAQELFQQSQIILEHTDSELLQDSLEDAKLKKVDSNEDFQSDEQFKLKEPPELIVPAIEENHIQTENESATASIEQTDLSTFSSVVPTKPDQKKDAEFYIKPTSSAANELFRLFVGDTNGFGHERIFEQPNRMVETCSEKLTDSQVLAHLRGETSISAYVQSTSGRVHCLVLDVDITKKALQSENFVLEEKLKEAIQVAMELQKQAKRLGFRSLLEDSGYRGYHLWIPFETALSMADAVTLTQILVLTVPNSIEVDITIERFPKSKRLTDTSKRQMIKLPCGRHPITGNWCRILDFHGNPVPDTMSVLQSFVPNSISHVQNVLRKEQMKANLKNQTPVSKASSTDSSSLNTIKLEELLPTTNAIEMVLNGCIVVRKLCELARKTSFLSHGDRQSLLNVFAHMGEDGCQYMHQVMKWTYNYRYDITQKFINRCPDRPIGCTRLREIYADRLYIKACTCNFPIVHGTYPSPVLYAHAVGESETATMPEKRAMNEKQRDQANETFNTHGQIQNLSQNLLTLNREKSRIEEEIEDCRQKLNMLFDMLNIEFFDIGIGVLTRKKEEDGSYSWIVKVE